jgi:O-antigen ligase
LNHLHNNLLQLALEIGWLGALAWLGWVTHVLVVALRAWRDLPRDQVVERATLIGALGGWIALLINGMVEFNFGDSEVYMLMNLLMGLILVQIQPRASFAVDRNHGVS